MNKTANPTKYANEENVFREVRVVRGLSIFRRCSRFPFDITANAGDLILVLSGEAVKTRKALGELRLLMGTQLGLRDKNKFAPLWVLDFPLLEWNEEAQRYHAMHHPFTSPKPEDIAKLDATPGQVYANAYDLVINGVEIGGGSIRTAQMSFDRLKLCTFE